jgi:hypothetical protein
MQAHRPPLFLLRAKAGKIRLPVPGVGGQQFRSESNNPLGIVLHHAAKLRNLTRAIPGVTAQPVLRRPISNVFVVAAAALSLGEKKLSRFRGDFKWRDGEVDDVSLLELRTAPPGALWRLGPLRREGSWQFHELGHQRSSMALAALDGQ